jgi:hypothetical protein
MTDLLCHAFFVIIMTEKPPCLFFSIMYSLNDVYISTNSFSSLVITSSPKDRPLVSAGAKGHVSP